jgi:putative flavoprotein involved in K+ transport
VYLSVGRCPWFPRRYRGREIVHWVIETGLIDDPVESLPSPSARLACNPTVSGNDGGHDCNPRWLARRGAILLGRVEDIDGETVAIGDGLLDSLHAGDEFVATLTRRIDELVETSGMTVDPPEPADADPAPEVVRSLDLRAAGISTILWANGFRPDHTWIDDVEVDEQGWPIQRDGVSTMPGVYFVGVHWLRKRKSALFVGVGEDAELVVRHLDTHRAKA